MCSKSFGVCEMRVDRLTALRSDYMGGAYYFCSSGCLEAFEGHPESYLAKSAPAR
jgi:YHS domain-containing protein